MMGLTAKQRELFDFIAATIAEKGVAPSFAEMRDAIGSRSTSRVAELVTALEERGYIRRIPNRARAIEIVERPAPALADAVALHPEVRAAAVQYAERTHTTLSAVISEAVAAYLGKAA